MTKDCEDAPRTFFSRKDFASEVDKFGKPNIAVLGTPKNFERIGKGRIHKIPKPSALSFHHSAPIVKSVDVIGKKGEKAGYHRNIRRIGYRCQYPKNDKHLNKKQHSSVSSKT